VKVKHIEILPHARNPVGNYAVIRLFGINRLEGPAAFIIEPGGDDTTPDKWPTGWPKGEQKPLGVRAGANSIDLLIGPDIVKAKPLSDGADIRFRMPRAAIDVTLKWPDLSAAPKRSAPKEGLSRLQIKTVAKQSEATPSAQSTSATAPAPLPPDPAPALTTRDDAKQKFEASQLQARARAGRKPGIDPKAVSAYTGFRARAEATRLAEAQASHSLPPFLIPGLLGLAVVAALFLTFAGTTPIDSRGNTLLSAWKSADGSNSSIRLPTEVLAEIMAIGTTSPGGDGSADVSPRQALERANNILGSAKTAKDRTEAAFWLRRALSRTLSEPRLVWAMTQLGAAHASSENGSKPNYQAAQVLWNWAADAGDAQAACFLGQLYERGLGTAQDATRARASYERAHRLGGCPGLEQAMLRVRN
jgi:TPR repeat protein